MWNKRTGAKKLMGLEPIVNLEEERASSNQLSGRNCIKLLIHSSMV
jgi:hypothetical protein